MVLKRVEPRALNQSYARLLRRLTTVLTLTVRPSTRYYPSLSSGLAILCAFWNICHSETPDKESFFRVAKFLKINVEILERSRGEIVREFASSARIRLHDCSRNAGDSTRMIYLICFQCFLTWYISLEWYLPTLCSAERAFSALHWLKTYLRSSMGQQRVSNVTLINIERAYANSVVIDIFGRQNGKEGYFF